MSATRDYYDVLGVPRDADEVTIKKAFRRLARELHPDVNRHDPQAEEKFKEAAEAYEVLSDRERRATYDRYGHEGLRSGGYAPNFEAFTSVADIFNAFFGGGGGGLGDLFGGTGRSVGPVQGGDVAVAVEIELADVARGTTVEARYEVVSLCHHCRGNGAEPGTPIETCPRCEGTGQLQSVARTIFGQVVRTHTCDRCGGDGRIAQTPCKVCRGSGEEVTTRSLTVDIPAGIADGQRVRVSGQGHAGALGGPGGDLYVLVTVAEDERFERRGDDLVTRVDVPFTDAALGGTIVVSTLDGDEEVELDAGTQPATIQRLRGRGLPALRGRGRGDLHVLLNVMIPSHLTDEQRELLERFADSANGETYSAKHDGLFDRIRQAFRG